MAKKVVISDVLKKHLKVVCYLTLSAVLAYLLSLLINKPEAICFMPIINYILYIIKQELDKEGVIQALRNG